MPFGYLQVAIGVDSNVAGVGSGWGQELHDLLHELRHVTSACDEVQGHGGVYAPDERWALGMVQDFLEPEMVRVGHATPYQHQ